MRDEKFMGLGSWKSGIRKTGEPDFGQGKNDDGVGPANVRPFV